MGAAGRSGLAWGACGHVPGGAERGCGQPPRLTPVPVSALSQLHLRQAQQRGQGWSVHVWGEWGLGTPTEPLGKQGCPTGTCVCTAMQGQPEPQLLTRRKLGASPHGAGGLSCPGGVQGPEAWLDPQGPVGVGWSPPAPVPVQTCEPRTLPGPQCPSTSRGRR